MDINLASTFIQLRGQRLLGHFFLPFHLPVNNSVISTTRHRMINILFHHLKKKKKITNKLEVKKRKKDVMQCKC